MINFVKIKENYIFRRAYAKGKAIVTPFAVVYILKNNRNAIRLGITASKKIGGAVERNRAKRVIFAAFSEIAPYIPKGYDFVIVARVRILKVKSTVVAERFLKELKSADFVEKNDK